MKKDIHPEYREITVVRPNGEKFTTRSTYKTSEILHLEVDPETHPAWNKGMQSIAKGGAVDKFKSRYSGLSSKKSADSSEEQKSA